MAHPILDNVAKSTRHTSFYLSCGDPAATPIIFVHGWPELSISWRHQLPTFASLGFHAAAPDMRGYGRSSVYARHEDYALEQSVADMIDLIDALGAEKAVWVGHDWGSPVVWSIAQANPDRCHGVANLCVPYLPEGFTPERAVALCNRDIYPEDQFPAAQWDYTFFYRENFDSARTSFESDSRATVRAFFRAGDPAGRGKPTRLASIRKNGGWFGPDRRPRAIPRDDAVLTLEDENAYVAALSRNGFFGPNSWYMNDRANEAYAGRAKTNWRLKMPVLFLHGEYDFGCETIDSALAGPMRAWCEALTEATIKSGHWMAQEKPTDVNAALAKWLAANFPALWPRG
jgi:pimeloyl-ACP methyl ester carboxylesterase